MKGRKIHSLNDGTGIVGSKSSSGKRKRVPKRMVYCEMKRKRKRVPQVGSSSSSLVMKM